MHSQPSNHFRDHLKRIQGIESTQISQHVIDKVKAELNKVTKVSRMRWNDGVIIVNELGLK